MSDTLAQELARVTYRDYYTLLSTQDAKDELVKKQMDDLEFVVIEEMDDPIFLFWQLIKEELLASGCYVVFLDINPTLPGWRDLSKDYEGMHFGSTFLLHCDTAHVALRIVPSQRGIFNLK